MNRISSGVIAAVVHAYLITDTLNSIIDMKKIAMWPDYIADRKIRDYWKVVWIRKQ